MKILLIHHLEPIWENGYKMFGTSFEEQLEKVREFLNENSFDRVILTQFENWKLTPEHWPIAEFITENYDYAYGWEEEAMKENPSDFVPGGNHSQVVYIPDWVKALKGQTVHLIGAFKGECLEDITIAMESQNVEVKPIDDLIVG
jgi:hypothetical protein